MSFNNVILGMGLEAFEDPADAIPTPADQVYDAPLAVEEANVLVVERNVAVEEREYAEAGAELSDALVANQSLIQTVENIDTLSASMEHFMEVGLSPEVSTMLYGQLASALENLGGDITNINGGLESFEDSKQVLKFFGDGLEALNDAKGSIGTKIAAGIVAINQSMNRWVEGVAVKTGRLRKDAGEVIKAAQQGSGSRTVKVKSKFLAVNADKPTTNLVGDLGAFTKVITDLSSGYMGKVGSFANGQINGALSSLKNATTLIEAKKIVDGIVPPPYPGASVSIKDTPKMTLKRTNVTLGGYAVFELRYKTTGGDTAPEIASTAKAIGMHRVSIKRPKEEKGSKVAYEATHTPQDAIAIANAVIKCCDAALAVQRNIKWTAGWLSGVSNHVKGLMQAVQSNNSAEKGVGVVVYTVSKLPNQLVDSVGSLVREIPDAVGNVCDAALQVAKQAARGGEGSAPAKDDKADE